MRSNNLKYKGVNMALYKCKMCGGALEIGENQSIVTCEYCCTQQTLPKVDDEKKLNLFNRANNLRLKSEFDKAAGIYESIIAEFPEESEAYWGLVLCKYGIEYVDDKDGRKIPTCHRTLPTPIMKDKDFQQACENADISAKSLYREEAKAIDGIQKKILEIAATEEPYDIFICYKETDDITGSRTEDSSIAQDIYTALTEMGYKVFYARNSLRKVAGTEYEPYIYAALSSAKIMLAIGTKYEYYDAVWVKNEWSRFISMIATNPSKILIPCFKNIDAYDIPEEFSNMQALDMADMMFFNSLEASVKRVLPLEIKAPVIDTTTVNTGASATVDSLLKRAFMFIEDGEWSRADDFCEQVLNIDPECAKAYLGKLLVELKVRTRKDLNDCSTPFNNSNNYHKILRFGNETLKNELETAINSINNRNEIARKDGIYNNAKRLMSSARSESDFKKAANEFKSINGYKDAIEHVEKCYEKAEVARKDSILSSAKQKMSGESIPDCQSAVRLFESIRGWKDADVSCNACINKIESLKVKAEERRIKEEARRIELQKQREEQRRQEEARRIEAEKQKEEQRRQEEERRLEAIRAEEERVRLADHIAYVNRYNVKLIKIHKKCVIGLLVVSVVLMMIYQLQSSGIISGFFSTLILIPVAFVMISAIPTFLTTKYLPSGTAKSNKTFLRILSCLFSILESFVGVALAIGEAMPEDGEPITSKSMLGGFIFLLFVFINLTSLIVTLLRKKHQL